jgi:hypothetical protein
MDGGSSRSNFDTELAPRTGAAEMAKAASNETRDTISAASVDLIHRSRMGQAGRRRAHSKQGLSSDIIDHEGICRANALPLPV